MILLFYKTDVCLKWQIYQLVTVFLFCSLKNTAEILISLPKCFTATRRSRKLGPKKKLGSGGRDSPACSHTPIQVDSGAGQIWRPSYSSKLWAIGLSHWMSLLQAHTVRIQSDSATVVACQSSRRYKDPSISEGNFS